MKIQSVFLGVGIAATSALATGGANAPSAAASAAVSPRAPASASAASAVASKHFDAERMRERAKRNPLVAPAAVPTPADGAK